MSEEEKQQYDKTEVLQKKLYALVSDLREDRDRCKNYEARECITTLIIEKQELIAALENILQELRFKNKELNFNVDLSRGEATHPSHDKTFIN